MNTPTKITIARIVFIPIFIILWYAKILGNYEFGSLHSLLVTGMFCLLSATDWLDGYLARKNNQITDLGKFLDPIADKILVFSAYLLLLDVSVIGPISLLLMLSREFIVATVRMNAAQEGVVIAANNGGKLKTVVQMISLILLLACVQDISQVASIIVYGLYYLSVILTVISGYSYTASYWKSKTQN